MFAFDTWYTSFTSWDTIVADSTSTFAYSIQKIWRSGGSSTMAKGLWHCVTQRLIRYQNSALLYVEPWVKSVIVCPGGAAFSSQLLTCRLRLLVDSSVWKQVTSRIILQLVHQVSCEWRKEKGSPTSVFCTKIYTWQHRAWLWLSVDS